MNDSNYFQDANVASLIPKPTKLNKIRRFSISKLLIYIVLTLWALTTIFPFVWVINNAFKAPNKILKYSFLPAWSDALNYTASDETVEITWEVGPDQDDKHTLDRRSPTMRNFRRAFNLGTGQNKLNIMRAYGYSLLISGTVTIVVMIFAGFAGFALVRYNFKGKSILTMMVTASLMFPAFSTIVPLLKMMTSLDLVDNPIGVILPQIAGNLAFAIIILTGYIRGLPVELEEAAFLEGCNVFQIFFKIIIPISLPSFSTVAIFTFLWSYNDLFLQKIIIRSWKKFPICAILSQISSQWGGTDYGLMCAAVTLVIVPVLIVYIFLQKNIIKGLTAGAIKG